MTSATTLQLTPRAPAVTLHLTKAAERRAKAVKRGEQRRVNAMRREHDLQLQRRDAALESIERTTARAHKSRHASIEDAANPRPLPARTFAVRLAERRRLATDAEPLMAAAALFAAEAEAAAAAAEAARSGRGCDPAAWPAAVAAGGPHHGTRGAAAPLAARASRPADERWRAAARAIRPCGCAERAADAIAARAACHAWRHTAADLSPAPVDRHAPSRAAAAARPRQRRSSAANRRGGARAAAALAAARRAAHGLAATRAKPGGGALW